jgi:hypothetical protein
VSAELAARACAKCAAALADGAVACARCGLVVANAGAFVARGEREAPAALRAAWERVLAAWDDPERHADFVHEAALASQLPWASRQYRAEQRQRPDDPRAGEMMARLARMAETVALVGDGGEAARRAAARAKLVRVVVVVLVLGLLLVLFLGYREMQRGAPPGEALPRVPPPGLFGDPVPGPAKGP